MTTAVPKAPVLNQNIEQVRDSAPVQWRRSPLRFRRAWSAAWRALR